MQGEAAHKEKYDCDYRAKGIDKYADCIKTERENAAKPVQCARKMDKRILLIIWHNEKFYG